MKLLLNRGLRKARKRENHDARRSRVDAMDGVNLARDALLFQVAGNIVCQGVLGVAHAGVHHHASRFIHRYEAFVKIKDLKRPVFGSDAGRAGADERIVGANRNGLAGVHLRIGACGLSIN